MLSVTPPDADTAAPAPPVVELLIRSMGRPQLAHALDAVAAQTADGLALVVVNASGHEHPPLPHWCGCFPMRLIEPGRPLSRAAAANAALQSARAPWLLFLDDDDLIDPDHVARLLAAAPPPPALGVYTGVRLQHADGRAGNVLDETWDADRLWRANFLPIHAVLFARRVLDAGCAFDESFEVYEDWNFWQQLARCKSNDDAAVAALWHLPGVSATYRLTGDSGLSDARDEALAARERTRFYAKWRPHLSAEGLERLMRSAELTHGALRTADEDRRAAEAEAEHTRRLLASAHHEGEQLRQQLADLHDTLSQQAGQHAQVQAQWDANVQALRQQAQQAQAEHHQQRTLHHALQLTYVALEAHHQATLRSLSWRLTAPLRAVRARLDPSGTARTLWRRLPLSSARRQRLKSHFAALPGGRHLIRQLAPHAAIHAPEPNPARPLDKQAVRNEAEATLGPFLAGGARLDLRCPTVQPQVSVIIVFFNQAGLSRLCLEALAASHGVSFETLLVDNGSSDRIPELLDRVDGAKRLTPGENLGFLPAVNLAAAEAQGRYLLLLNNDALVEPATLASEGHAVTHYPLQFPRENRADVARALPETVEVMLDHGHAGLAGFLHARRGFFDVAIVSRPHNMQALREIRATAPTLLAGTRLVYDAEALLSLRNIAKAALDGRPMSADEQRRQIQAELALAEGAAAILAVSEAEAMHYRAAGYPDVQVLGHELAVTDDTPGFASRLGFLFVGALPADDTPNGDSVLWFVREVWPHITTRLGPEVALHVVVPRSNSTRSRRLKPPLSRRQSAA